VERTLLPARVANLDPRWLDQLCLSGAVGWGRISPHPAWSSGEGSAPRRVIPTNAAPIAFFVRETAEWLPHALRSTRSMSRFWRPRSARRLSAFASCCASAALVLPTTCNGSPDSHGKQTCHALWELATAGLAAADGFDQLRALMDPRRKSTTGETPGKRTRGPPQGDGRC